MKKNIVLSLIFVFSTIFMFSGCTTDNEIEKVEPANAVKSLIEEDIQIDEGNSTSSSEVKADPILQEVTNKEGDDSEIKTESPTPITDNYEKCAQSYYERCYINNPKPANQQRCLEGMKHTVELNCPEKSFSL